MPTCCPKHKPRGTCGRDWVPFCRASIFYEDWGPCVRGPYGRTLRSQRRSSVIGECGTWKAQNTYIHTLNGPFSGSTRVSHYQKGKTNLDFIEPRDSEWQWLQLGHMQVCTSLQTDDHASTPLLSFLQAVCPSCRPTNSVKALKAQNT